MTKRTPKDVFLAAFELVRNKKTWTRGVMAQSRGGVPVLPTSPDACRWCSLGAVNKFDGGPSTGSRVIEELIKTCDQFFGAGIIECNDTLHHSKVVAIWRETGERMGWLEGSTSG